MTKKNRRELLRDSAKALATASVIGTATFSMPTRSITMSFNGVSVKSINCMSIAWTDPKGVRRIKHGTLHNQLIMMGPYDGEKV